MHTCRTRTILLMLLLASSGYGFFLNRTIPAVSRNIVCIDDFQVYVHTGIFNTSLFNNTPDNITSTSLADFCVIYFVIQTSSNGTQMVYSLSTGLSGFNEFQQLSRRCGPYFSPSNTPIGYGTCTPYADSSMVVTLCICSTSYCNYDYPTCVTSVTSVQNTSLLPANLPTLIPELTNIITCQSGYQGATYSYQYNQISMFLIDSVSVGVTPSYNYTATHAVACIYMLNQNTGDWVRGGLVYESYPFELYTALVSAANFNLTANSFGETATSAFGAFPATYIFTTNQSFTEIMCICTTDNCNVNAVTCATGSNNIYTTTSTTSILTTTSTTSILTTTSTTSILTTTSATSIITTTSATSILNTTSNALNISTTSTGTSKMKTIEFYVYFIYSIYLIHLIIN